ncbi:12406_t:CDS:2, partial [Entrophospora sp. SA101]
KNAQTRDQFNLWKAEQIEMYRKCNSDMIRLFLDRKYEEYYIPYDWIELLRQQGYRVVIYGNWHEILEWTQNPEYYANLTYPDIVRI